MTRVTPDLVVLGNLLVDDVVHADGRTRLGEPGGAMLYASLAAALWGARVGCVSLRGDDYPATALDTLRAHGVLLDGVHALGGNGVRTWLLYEGGVRRVIHRLGCPSHEAVSPLPEHVPPAWRRSRAFHLAPMPIATQRALVAAIRGWEASGAPAFVSVDPHVPLAAETLPTWRALLADVDVFFPSDDEWRLPDAARDPAAALATLAPPSPARLRWIAWKRGAAGGSLYDVREGRLRAWPARAVRIEDPTGAGDAFMAGFVTGYLEGRGVEHCLRRAVVTASFAIESCGAERLATVTRAEAEARLAAWDATEVRS